MAIKYLAGNRLSGLAADSKPINVPVNSIFIETDTPALFIWDGATWTVLGGSCVMVLDESGIVNNPLPTTNEVSGLTHALTAGTSFVFGVAKTVNVDVDDSTVVIVGVGCFRIFSSGLSATIEIKEGAAQKSENTVVATETRQGVMVSTIAVLTGVSSGNHTYDINYKSSDASDVALYGVSIGVAVIKV